MAFVLVPAPADVSNNTFCCALHTDTALQGENCLAGSCGWE